MQPTDLLHRVTFRATVERAGVRVPADAVRSLAAGRRPLVRVTIGEHSYQSRVAVRAGRFMLPLGAAARAAAGEVIEVSLELDTEPRTAAVPSDLADALESAPEALHYFESLPYGRQHRLVRNVEEAPTAETRRRRIDRTVERLRSEAGIR